MDIFAYNGAFTGGVRVASADMNGDCQADIITAPGAGGGPHIRVFDARTGAVIKQFFGLDGFHTGGVNIAMGDANGDGVPDFFLGAEGVSGNGRAQVVDGATLAVIRNFTLNPAAFGGGVRVAAGDVNGDGRADLIAGAGPGNTPRVTALDAVTGGTLADFFAYAPAFSAGVYVSAGDFNGDGRADIVTGPGWGGGPHVLVYNAANAQPIRSVFAYNPSYTGGVKVATVDANNDGRLDIAVAPGFGGGPHVRQLDGQTMAVINEFFAYHGAFTGGVFVAGGKPAGFGGSPLRAADGMADIITDAPALTDDALAPIVEQARLRLAAANLSAEASQRLASIDVRVSNLAGDYLGLAYSDHIAIDIDAAGYGWFIDATPDADEEFTGDAQSPARDRMDLLSVVMHELGHAIGLDDLDPVEFPDEIMSATLETGVRRASEMAVDDIFANDAWE
jgi:hypothetical protein